MHAGEDLRRQPAAHRRGAAVHQRHAGLRKRSRPHLVLQSESQDSASVEGEIAGGRKTTSKSGNGQGSGVNHGTDAGIDDDGGSKGGGV